MNTISFLQGIVFTKAEVFLAEKSYVTRSIEQTIEVNHWQEEFCVPVNC